MVLTNGDVEDAVNGLSEEDLAIAELQPGMFESGMLHAVIGEGYSPHPYDTAEESAAYFLGFKSGLSLVESR